MAQPQNNQAPNQHQYDHIKIPKFDGTKTRGEGWLRQFIRIATMKNWADALLVAETLQTCMPLLISMKEFSHSMTQSKTQFHCIFMTSHPLLY